MLAVIEQSISLIIMSMIDNIDKNIGKVHPAIYSQRASRGIAVLFL